MVRGRQGAGARGLELPCHGVVSSLSAHLGLEDAAKGGRGVRRAVAGRFAVPGRVRGEGRRATIGPAPAVCVQAVPYEMSLSAVKKFIWGRSGDVLFEYRVRDPLRPAPMPVIQPPKHH